MDEETKIEEEQAEKLTSELGREILRTYALRDSMQYFQGKSAGKVKVVPILHFQDPIPWVEFRIGIKTLYILKDVQGFVHQLDRHARVRYGKKLEILMDRSAFCETSLPIVDFMVRAVKELEQMESPLLTKDARKLSVTPRLLDDLLDLGGEILIFTGHPSPMAIRTADPQLDVWIQKGEGGVLLQSGFFWLAYGRERLIVQWGNVIYRCSEEYSKEMRPFLAHSVEAPGQQFFVAEADLPVLITVLLPTLQKYCNVQMEDEVLERFRPEPAQVRIYIEEGEENLLKARIETFYGEKQYNVFDPVRLGDTYRDVAKESAALHVVRHFFPEVIRKEKRFGMRSEEDFFAFLEEGQQTLSKVGEVYISGELRKWKIRNAPRLQAGISMRNHLLHLQILSDDLPYEELERLLENYREKKKFFRLRGGDFIRLEDNSLETLSEILDGLHLETEDWRTGEMELPRYRAMYLNEVLKENTDGLQVTRDTGFQKLVSEILSAEKACYPVPETMETILREYQKAGYQWMRTLDAMGFGGILADDMGLGKTVQVIALILSYRSEETEQKAPVLIVCPASLIYNWQSEIRRFAPDLHQVVIAGSMQEREQLLLDAWEIPGCVLITSYDLLKRDLAQYQNHIFRYQFLDEAQMIKNHMTKAARAVKKIQAISRFALTGTPIENRLSELWSIFDFLMPGMLFSYSRFQKEFEGPIVREEDERAIKRLRQLTRPFVLRRLKADVLKELPDKSEITIYAGMEEEQRQLYDANVWQLKSTLAYGTQKSMQILAALVRLRQICCDPALVYENYKGSSAKKEACTHLLQEAAAGGHKVLVFSQFASMLRLLAQSLDAEHISYYMLTGSVSKEKRAEMVRDFHMDDTPVFLISLKAGGTGLNLTAADIVIHYDPWWNLAAQNQATDRAHRIGQKHKVTVFRLIAKNTIEERILEMQESKRLLSSQIITEESLPKELLSPDALQNLL